jgi:hypothetical protein
MPPAAETAFTKKSGLEHLIFCALFYEKWNKKAGVLVFNSQDLI